MLQVDRIAVLVAVIAITSASVAESKELRIGKSASPADWTLADRLAWVKLSNLSDWNTLKSFDPNKNSFTKAAISNTESNKPGEYQTISERNSYYDWWSVRLRQTVALADVRFFDAAGTVTGKFGGLALAEHPLLPFAMKLTSFVEQQDLELFRELNVELFSLNVLVLHNLSAWGEPRDPTDPKATTKISGFDFDCAMVKLEQSTVERALQHKLVLATEQKRINNAVRAALKYRNWSFRVSDYLAAAGIKEFDFFNVRHRVALGTAYVFFFHKKSLSDFVAYQSSPAQTRSPLVRMRPK